MSDYKIGLAAGVVMDLTPPETVEAAARAGFDYAGLWFDKDKWTDQTTRDVRTRLRDTGITAVDIEPIFLGEGPIDPSYFYMLDQGAEAGASNVLLVSRDPDMSATAAKIHELCEYATPLGLRICLEFGLFTQVKSLKMARSVIEKVNHPTAGILIDALHLQRSGGRPADVAATPRELLPYAQICDAPENGPTADDPAGIIKEAIDERLQTGDGGLPLAALIAALPAGIPLSVELRSKAMREGYPDPYQRAQATHDATRQFLREMAAVGA